MPAIHSTNGPLACALPSRTLLSRRASATHPRNQWAARRRPDRCRMRTIGRSAALASRALVAGANLDRRPRDVLDRKRRDAAPELDDRKKVPAALARK